MDVRNDYGWTAALAPLAWGRTTADETRFPAVRDAGLRRALAAACALMVAALATGCSFFDRDDTETVSVFDLDVGTCVLAPDAKEVTTDLTSVSTIPCDQPHELEVYALVDYPDPAGDQTGAASTFPGDATLKDFADGVCAEEFADYVGVDYRDSTLWFTYLVPSARSWQAEDDRTVVCLITTTGEQLTQSVAGTGW